MSMVITECPTTECPRPNTHPYHQTLIQMFYKTAKLDVAQQFQVGMTLVLVKNVYPAKAALQDSGCQVWGHWHWRPNSEGARPLERYRSLAQQRQPGSGQQLG